MKKEDLQAKISELEQEIKRRDEANRDNISINNIEYNRLMDADKNYNDSLNREALLNQSVNDLIKALSEANGGVLKDLSQTIVNLTSKSH